MKKTRDTWSAVDPIAWQFGKAGQPTDAALYFPSFSLAS
jgi:hypothetical protein